jgi:hypothetical protein
MKLYLYVGCLLFAVSACSSVKEGSKTTAKLTQKSQDTTEYELIIIDIQFDNWYLINYSPAKDRTNEYYRSKNMIAVINWNDYYRKGKYSRVIDSYIDYQPSIDYGIEVNRKLYWYFTYIVENYKVQLFNRSMSP